MRESAMDSQASINSEVKVRDEDLNSIETPQKNMMKKST
jgi:hypothetical protein